MSTVHTSGLLSANKRHRRLTHTPMEALEPRLLLSASTADAGVHDASSVPEPSTVYTRQVENLDRGVVAIRQSSTQVYVSWRMLGLDGPSIGFNLYRQANGGTPVRLNSGIITQTTDYLDTTATQGQAYTYFVRTFIDGIEGPDSAAYTLSADTPTQPYLSVPLQAPPGGLMPDGSAYTYSANDASVGDVDGDGQYEIILKWDPSNAKDNSQSGVTANVFIDAYKLDGTLLWRINLGRNIRAGAHYTQFMVYDLDGDGRAEVAMKTAPGTIDGQGNPVLMGADQVGADYRNSDGYILSGPEYFTVFDGFTGAQLDTVAFEPARGSTSQWGDTYGNRVDRFTAGIAYLDGARPSIVMGRGYYHPQSGLQARNEVVAYDFRDNQLSIRWHFKAASNGPNSQYVGQGAHSLTVGDVDGDGFDEVVYGAAVIDDDGTGLYSTGLGHGDALHMSDMDPSRPGLEVFMVHESPGEFINGSVNAGGELRDAATGQLLVAIPATNDVGRGVAMDIDPNYAGYEFWATTADPNGNPRMIYNVSGQALYQTPSNMPYNFGVWWDADMLRETLDGTTIGKWHYEWSTPGRQNYVMAWEQGAASNNGTKSTPALSADILGDWREEVIWRNADSSELQIWTTTIQANSRMYTLMHDTQYRVSIAAQNSAYNQPPHPSFFVGAGMDDPPQANVSYAGFIGELPDPSHPSAYQSEYAIYGGLSTTVESNHAGFNGGGFINFSAADGFVQFDHIDAGLGGDTTIRFRYALGSTERSGQLVINGVSQSITFPTTTTWDNWSILELTVNLNPGTNNTIRLETHGEDLANIDELVVEPSSLAGDLNGDGFVGIADLNIVLGNWNQAAPPANPAADPSGDNFVGIADLNIVLGNWNAATPPSSEIAVAPLPQTVSSGPIEIVVSAEQASSASQQAVVAAASTVNRRLRPAVDPKRFRQNPQPAPLDPTTQSALAHWRHHRDAPQRLGYGTPGLRGHDTPATMLGLWDNAHYFTDDYIETVQ